MTQGGIELVTAYVSIVPEGSRIAPEVRRQFNQVGRDADRAGRESGRRFSSGLSGALKRSAFVAGVGGLGLLAAGVVKTSVSLEASFSKTMAQIGASTDGASAHMDELNKLAMKLGAETSFSASDAANAMLELGKAGINASDIMGGALKGTLLLAAAGSTDLGTASTIAANAMNTFGLKGKDMNTIAAALAGGANASSASVESLGQALQQVGPGATNAGLSLQETVGALSAFDAAGIKGSDAGTSLKTMLSRLVPQTDAAKVAMAKLGLKFTDAKGNFVPITNVAEQLKNKLSGLSEAQRTTALTTIFGSDATRAATVLMKQGSAGLEKYIKATKDQNAAQKLAKANMSGTSGALERLRGSVETAELALGKALAPTVEKVADFLSKKAVPAITDFVTGMEDGTGAGGDLVDTLKSTVAIGKGIFKFFNSMPGPVKKYGAEIAIAAVAIGKMNSAMAASKFSGFITDMRNAETRAARTSRGLQGLGAGIRNVAGAGGMILLADSTDKSSRALGVLEGAAGGALTGAALGGFAGPVGAGIGAAVGGLAGGFLSLTTNTKNAGRAAGPTAAEFSALKDTLDGVTGATTAATSAMVNQRFTTTTAGKAALKVAQDAGITQRQLVDAEVKGGTVRDKVIHQLNQQTVAIRKNAEARRAVLEQNFRTQSAQSSNLDLSPNQRAAFGRDASATKKELDGLSGLTKERLKAVKATLEELGVVDQAVAAKQKDIAATKVYKNLVKSGIPKVIATDIQTKGIVPTTTGVATLLAKYKDLSKQKIATIIKESGADTTVAAVQRVIEKIRAANKVRLGIDVDTSGIDSLNGKLALALNHLTALNKRAAGGADGDPLTPRALGGPVNAGQPYIVGEHRPELFIPNQAGRILPRVPATAAAPGSSSIAGQRLFLVLDDGTTIGGYIDDRADVRIGAASQIAGMKERAL
jgi:TP901 family phage tail tape measure protein